MAMALVPTLLFFDPGAGDEQKPARRQNTDAGPKKEKRLFCAACRHPVTHQDQRVPVRGAHEHRCTNPHGLVFHIGCFRAAPGCAAVGEATTEYSWFPGYAWRIALCAHCRAHLGWHFRSPADEFHGLIVARLTSAGPIRN